MLLHPLELTTALRPSLLPDETLLFVQDAVGLYQGNLKIVEFQNGQAYLTSHRACYVDNEDPRGKSVAASLKDVERSEFYAGFLKSSPKVTLHPKAAKQFGVPQNTNGPVDGHTNASQRSGDLSIRSSTIRSSTPNPSATSNPNATWICPICSFSNPVPTHFDPATANENTPLAPCPMCGMKPPLVTIVKAAIVGMSNRPPDGINAGSVASSTQSSATSIGSSRRLVCPRCTFGNHPSMSTCEICGAPLKTNNSNTQPGSLDISRSSSPAPTAPSRKMPDLSNAVESMKFSFHSGGEKIFHDRLKGALVQRKWLLQSAPAASVVELSSASPGGGAPPPPKNIGISGLERRDREQRKNNEVVIGNAFEDLSALMASAKEIIALAEQFSKKSRPSDSGASTPDQAATPDTSALLSSLNLTTTREMLGSPYSSSSASNSLYLKQLARSVADFLLDDRSGSTLLRSSGGIISLVDLWAVYNRARGGVELVSPKDFSDAVALFRDLKLPVNERVFAGSGLRTVRGAEWSDERISQALLAWLRMLREELAAQDSRENIDGNVGITTAALWGRGVTALETAEHFGWSVGVATDELERMAEENTSLCRDVGPEGARFWENWFVRDRSSISDGAQTLDWFEWLKWE